MVFCGGDSLPHSRPSARTQTEAALMVSIDYHEPEESIRRYGEKAMELDRVFRPVFPFAYGGERRAATVARVTTNISGGMLHLTFPSYLSSYRTGRRKERRLGHWK
ncbi:MAG: hypothetical protein ACLTW9_04315 [Enterocloster sp.]